MAKKKKRRKRTKDKRAFQIKLKRGTIYSIVQVMFYTLAGLVIVSFSRQGLILVRLNDLLVEYLSWTTIFLPFIFLSSGLLLSKLKIPLGQPNVLVGSLIFFVSATTLFRAGTLGEAAWGGIVTLITSAGSYIVLTGTTLIGLIVLFNTSLDKVFQDVISVVRKYGFGGPKIQKGFPKTKQKEMKVVGGKSDRGKKDLEVKGGDREEKKGETTDEDLSPKLVSNVRGEDKVWKHPPLDLLTTKTAGKADRGDIKGNAATIEETLESFGITAKVVEVNLGPAVTQYAMEVALGTKLSKITSLERDLALALAAPTGTIRIEAPIPGRSLVGIELPNKNPEFVPVKTMLVSDEMKEVESKLAVSLGLDVSGNPIIANLGVMPHVLIAGQTGSGKSVCINSFLTTLLFRASPSEVKLILVDPKRVELTGYNGVPHLLTPVIVDPKKVISALRWVLSEMDRRYKLFSQAGVRNINSYNEVSGFQALPYIVLFVDELA
ncbi:MAG: DNA translocase FtsK, partial [Candidatus Woesebacteria bacterium]